MLARAVFLGLGLVLSVSAHAVTGADGEVSQEGDQGDYEDLFAGSARRDLDPVQNAENAPSPVELSARGSGDETDEAPHVTRNDRHRGRGDARGGRKDADDSTGEQVASDAGDRRPAPRGSRRRPQDAAVPEESGVEAPELAATRPPEPQSSRPADLEVDPTLDPRSRQIALTVKDRARQLLSEVRGAPGEAIPGAAVLASPLAFGAAAPSGLMKPSAAALAAAGVEGRDGGLRLANALTRDAGAKIAIGDFRGAETLLNKRLGENPSDAPALRLRAFALRQLRDFRGSAEDARAALALAPWDWRSRQILIDDLVDAGDSREALKEADKAVQESPGEPRFLVSRARVWESLGERERQLEDLRQAAELDDQFDALYAQARQAPQAGRAPAPARPGSTAVRLAAAGAALMLLSILLYRRRGDSSVRLAMRAEDHVTLSRGARPAPAPAGFRIVRTLGQGGMGVVYEAVDLGLQRTVALKKLREEVAGNARERSRFLKEARTVAALKHPNIVSIHAIHEDAEGLFLVFEKLAGTTLQQRVADGPLPPAEAAALLRQIAQALDHAHGQGVVHQDLKPSNVMVDGPTAKVMDFGIARRVQETLSTLSRVEIAGTPAYMAPEQENGQAVGPAADVYALGACAYELLTGRPPYPVGGLMMKMERMYPPLIKERPGLPEALEAVVARALHPHPSSRWPSAAAFADAFARAAA